MGLTSADRGDGTWVAIEGVGEGGRLQAFRPGGGGGSIWEKRGSEMVGARTAGEREPGTGGEPAEMAWGFAKGEQCGLERR